MSNPNTVLSTILKSRRTRLWLFTKINLLNSKFKMSMQKYLGFVIFMSLLFVYLGNVGNFFAFTNVRECFHNNRPWCKFSCLTFMVT